MSEAIILCSHLLGLECSSHALTVCIEYTVLLGMLESLSAYNRVVNDHHPVKLVICFKHYAVLMIQALHPFLQWKAGLAGII